MTKELFDKLKETFAKLGAEGLALNHYELTEKTGFGTPSIWKEFLMEPEIKQYVSTEAAIIRNADLNKITTDLKGSRSVGQAQLISALTKLEGQNINPEGPVFIYSYVPLSEDQKAAPNIILEEKDIFLKNNIHEISIEDLEKYNIKQVFLVSEIGKFWGIVHYTKKFIIIPDMPNLDFEKIKIKGFKIYPQEV